MMYFVPASLRRKLALWLCPDLAFRGEAPGKAECVPALGGHKYHILTLAARLGAHQRVTHWAISMRLAGKGDFLQRLERGGDCRTSTYERAMQFFARTWPADLEWPSDVPRPARVADAGGAAAPGHTHGSTKEANDG